MKQQDMELIHPKLKTGIPTRRVIQTKICYITAGDKYPSTALLSMMPAKDVPLQLVERALMQELEALATDGITQKELQRIKKVIKTFLDLLSMW